MKQNKIEKLLRQESNLLLVGVKQNIQQSHFKDRQIDRPRSRWYRKFALPLMAAMAILIGFIVFPINRPTTLLAFAINPEVQIGLNSRDKVVSIEGLNTDGAILVYDEDFIGLSLEESIDKLMGLYDEFGFLDSNPTINMLSYHRLANKESAALTRMSTSVQNFLATNGVSANMVALNQETRTLNYLKNRLVQQGYGDQTLSRKSIRQLLRLRYNYNEEEIKTMIANLKALRSNMAHMTQQERQAAMMLIKRNQFHRNR